MKKLMYILCFLSFGISIHASFKRTDGMKFSKSPKMTARPQANLVEQAYFANPNYKKYVALCARMYQITEDQVKKNINSIWPVEKRDLSVELNMASQAANLNEVKRILQSISQCNRQMLQTAILFANQEYEYALCENFSPIGDRIKVINALQNALRRLKKQ